ncbi:MAG TPA: hypothetical protein VHW09_27350 [Bryobacteraceae bacterium]|jgi:hypothetical protein|nr:hypothetical protein [Bryobacteraceae bacterium]
MAFLDWLRDAGNRDPKNIAREHGHESFAGLAAEINHDEKLAKERDTTGREPQAGQVPEAKPEAAKAQPRRERMRGHDIPF